MTNSRPKPIGDIVAQLMARRGYANERSAAVQQEAWAAAAGQALARFTRVGLIRRGVLEVMVANSTMMQELTFQKTSLLEKLKTQLPDAKLRDLRFRIGAIE